MVLVAACALRHLYRREPRERLLLGDPFRTSAMATTPKMPASAKPPRVNWVGGGGHFALWTIFLFVSTGGALQKLLVGHVSDLLDTFCFVAQKSQCSVTALVTRIAFYFLSLKLPDLYQV